MKRSLFLKTPFILLAIFAGIFFFNVNCVIALSNSNLNGQYIYIGQDTDGIEEHALLTFDGNGTGTFQLLASNDPDDDFFGTDNFTYNVASDGTFTAGGGGGDIQGLIRSDGDVGIATVFSGGSSTIQIFVKKSSGMSNASLNGEYIYVGQDTNGIGEHAFMTFNGNGTGTFQLLASNDPDDNFFGTDNFTYNVASDGTFTAVGVGNVINGIISPDGTLGIATVFGDNDATFEMFVKKSSSMSDASLDGEFIYAGQGTEGIGERALLTFNGNGTGTFQLLASNDPDDDFFGTDDFTYNVASDGTFTAGGFGNAINGIISPDGTLGIATVFGDNDATFEVFVKKSSEDDDNVHACFISTLLR